MCLNFFWHDIIQTNIYGLFYNSQFWTPCEHSHNIEFYIACCHFLFIYRMFWIFAMSNKVMVQSTFSSTEKKLFGRNSCGSNLCGIEWIIWSFEMKYSIIQVSQTNPKGIFFLLMLTHKICIISQNLPN